MHDAALRITAAMRIIVWSQRQKRLFKQVPQERRSSLANVLASTGLRRPPRTRGAPRSAGARLRRNSSAMTKAPKQSTSFRMSMYDTTNVAMEGWLSKQAGGVLTKGAWQKRYFMLTGCYLKYTTDA
jgi:hypothetical protein